MSFFTRILRLGQNDHYKKGILCYNKGEYDKAVDEFEKATAQAGQLKGPYYSLGMFYAAEARSHLGLAYFSKGDFKRAEEEFAKAIQTNPNYPDLHYYRGVIGQKIGRYKESAKHLERALELNPGYSEARCYLIAVYSSMGRDEDARRELATLRTSGFAVPERLGEASQGSVKEVDLEELLGAADRKSKHILHLGNAISYYNRGSLDEAVAELKQAVEAEPSYADLRCRLGTVLAEKGEIEEAKE